jgi:hypothetical protein
VLHCTLVSQQLVALGHSRPGPAGRRSSHVRYAPKATFGHQNAIGRDGPKADILRCSEEHPYSIASPACGCVQFTFLDTL